MVPKPTSHFMDRPLVVGSRVAFPISHQDSTPPISCTRPTNCTGLRGYIILAQTNTGPSKTTASI